MADPFGINDPQDALSMTHWPVQPNPAAPYVQGVRNFASGGLQRAFDLPNSFVGRALQNPDNVAAMGMAAGIPSAPEKIVAAATKYGGKVFTGNVHTQSVEAAAKANNMDVMEFIDHVNKQAGKSEAVHDLDGFVTSTGRFVTREEANSIARKAGQMTKSALEENDPALSMEYLKLEDRPGFGLPSVSKKPFEGGGRMLLSRTPATGSPAANLSKADLSNLRSALREKLYTEKTLKALDQKTQDFYETRTSTPKGFHWENGKLVKD